MPNIFASHIAAIRAELIFHMLTCPYTINMLYVKTFVCLDHRVDAREVAYFTRE